jgi:DNA-binding winged helix-turn-helix (wHTH) protein/Tfp pilus assembly protein PilF
MESLNHESSNRKMLFRFDGFELDVASAELRKDGVPVKLAPQPFAALHLLVSRAGELVTRDELCAALWKDDRFVDFNAGLNFCIAQLRTALDDPASRPRFIVTIPRRGYKFAGEVSKGAPNDPAVVTQIESRVVTWRASAAGAALVAIAIGFGAWVQFRAAPPVLARSLKALQKYERGISGLGDAAPQELLDRVRFFDEALAGDAKWPEAWAGVAEAKLVIGNYRAESPQVAYATAKAAAAKAIALDDRLGTAHSFYGAAVMYFDWDWETAGKHLRRGVALAPSSPRAHYWYSRYLSARGEHARAVEHARTAVSLAPASPSVRTQLGLANFYAGRFDEARNACNEAVQLMPEFLPARGCASASEMESSTPAQEFWTARLERLRTGRSEQDLLDLSVTIAATLVHAGNRDEALDVLELAANRRVDVLIFAGVHPALQPLSNEPRYRRILQRVGLM